MFHSNTQRVIDYWHGLRVAAQAPARADFDPASVASILSQLFMLDRAPGLPFRLAGALVEDLHGRGLRREPFLDLWSVDSRAAVRDAAVAALKGPEPVVLYAEARTSGKQTAGLEILLAALTGPDDRADRLVGICQPVTTLVRLHGEALTVLEHKLTVYPGGRDPGVREPHLRLAAVDGRRITRSG